MNSLKLFWQKSRWNKLIVVIGTIVIGGIILSTISSRSRESFQKGFETGSNTKPSPSVQPTPSAIPVNLTIENFCPSYQQILTIFNNQGFTFSEENDLQDEIEYKAVSKDKNTELNFPWGKPKDERIDPADVDITMHTENLDEKSLDLIYFQKFLEVVGPPNFSKDWLAENVKNLLSSQDEDKSASIDKDYKNILLIRTDRSLSLSVSPLKGSPDCPSNFKRFLSYKELPSYKKGNVVWKSIVVLPDIPSVILVDLAKQIHQKDPNSKYHIFDDEAQFEAFKNWDINYDEENYPSPEDWVRKHDIAIINRMGYGIGDLRWQLYFQIPGGNRFHLPGDLAVDLE